DPLSAALSDDPFSLTVSGDAEESATTFSNDAADFDMAEFDEAFGTSSDTVRDADAYDDEDEAEEDFNGLSFDPIADEGTEDKTLFMRDPDVMVPPSVETSTAKKTTANPFEVKEEEGSGDSAFEDSAFEDSVFEDSAFEDSTFEDSAFSRRNLDAVDSDVEASESSSLGRSTGSAGFSADAFDDFDDFESVPDFDLSDSSAGFTSPSIGAMPSQFGNSQFGTAKMRMLPVLKVVALKGLSLLRLCLFLERRQSRILNPASRAHLPLLRMLRCLLSG
ncbi:MAG: hypothetical protein HC800_18950, partial [Phormidesmis sp. RL_2_1]|nr:hypothetical protein [Phormidesmis sp. RL_2_1]